MNFTEFKVVAFVVCFIFLLSYWSEETGAQMYVDYWKPSGRFGKRGHVKVKRRMKTEKMPRDSLPRDSQVKEADVHHLNSMEDLHLSKRRKTMKALDDLYDGYGY